MNDIDDTGPPKDEKLCGKPGCFKKAYPGQKYCCREHAPFGKLGHEQGTPLEESRKERVRVSQTISSPAWPKPADPAPEPVSETKQTFVSETPPRPPIVVEPTLRRKAEFPPTGPTKEFEPINERKEDMPTKGLTNQELADALGVSYNTIMIYQKKNKISATYQGREKWKLEHVREQLRRAGIVPGSGNKAAPSNPEPKKKPALGRGVTVPKEETALAVTASYTGVEPMDIIRNVEREARRRAMVVLVDAAEKKHEDGDDTEAYTILRHVVKRAGLLQ